MSTARGKNANQRAPLTMDLSALSLNMPSGVRRGRFCMSKLSPLKIPQEINNERANTKVVFQAKVQNFSLVNLNLPSAFGIAFGITFAIILASWFLGLVGNFLGL